MQRACRISILISYLLFGLENSYQSTQAAEPAPRKLPERKKIVFSATADTTQQAAYLSGPFESAHTVPLVVSLHSWSGNLEQRQENLEVLLDERGWFCLQPNFRGVNQHPLACASPAAQQDIIDVLDLVIAEYPIDHQRIYLTGNSGGGHMTLMMVAQYPSRWTAASAWVGISDLVSWHAQHADGKYGRMLRDCCGGPPGASPEVDEQYRARSPIHFLHNAQNVALDIASGIHDGHAGSVPTRHSLEAFNRIAAAVAAPEISQAEIQQMSKDDGRLETPQPQDETFDASFGRHIYLRRHAGRARVTIFEGGHEGIATAALAWFDAHPLPHSKP